MTADLLQPFIKIAEEASNDFESSFAGLAHAVLKEKAPALLDHEVGFQVVERDDDDNRAAGVFAFRIGNRWMYAPCVFSRGRIEGPDMLVLPDQDQYVPLRENWLNTIMRRGQPTLGAPGKSPSQRPRPSTPDLYSMQPGYGYGYKFAGVWDVTEAVWPDLAEAVKHPSFAKQFRKLAAHPQVRLAIDRLHGAGYTDKLLKSAAVMPSAMMPAPVPGMAVGGAGALGGVMPQAPPAPTLNPWQQFQGWTDRHMGYLPQGLPGGRATALLGGLGAAGVGLGALTASNRDKKDEETAQAEMTMKGAGVFATRPTCPPDLGEVSVWTAKTASGGVFGPARTELVEALLFTDAVVEDTRKSAASTYEVAAKIRLIGPYEPGVYDVLQPGGKHERALVLYGDRGFPSHDNPTTVVWLDGNSPSGWQNSHPAKVSIFAPQGEAGDKVRDGLKAVYEAAQSPGDFKPSTENYDTCYLLFNEKGKSTFPFRVSEIMEGGDKSYRVYFRNNAPCDSTYGSPSGSSGLSYAGSHMRPYSDPEPDFITFSGQPGDRLVVVDGRLIVPEGYKVLKLEDGEDRILADRMDVQDLLYRKTAALAVEWDFDRYVVNGYKAAAAEAIRHLVVDWDLRESDAREILTEARTKRAERRVVPSPWLEKVAAEFPGFPAEPEGEDTAYGQVPARYNYSAAVTNTPQNESSPMEPPDPYTQAAGIQDGGVDPELVQRVLQSAQGGQKEILDTSIVSQVLRSTEDDSLVDQYLPNFMKTIDNLGRMSLAISYRPEIFEERYGKTDLAELKDSVRREFKELGDLALFLKTKTVEPFPDAALQGLSGSVE